MSQKVINIDTGQDITKGLPIFLAPRKIFIDPQIIKSWQ